MINQDDNNYNKEDDNQDIDEILEEEISEDDYQFGEKGFEPDDNQK